MHLRIEERRLAKKEDLERQIHNRLFQIQDALSLTDETFRELLGLTSREYEKFIHRSSKIRAESVVLVCQALDLNLDLFFHGKIDLIALRRQFFGDKQAVPERYEIEAQKLSRMRSVKTIYNFLAKERGCSFAKEIFGRKQVSLHAIDDPNGFVSPMLSADIMQELRRENFSDDDIRRIGTASLGVYRSTPLGLALSKSNSPRDLYRSMHEEHMHYFDKIWNYRLVSLHDNGCTIEVTQKPYIAEIFKSNIIGNREICLARQGVYSTILGNLEVRHAHLNESECIYLGDPQCSYHLIW